jgi:hypothetical protein
MPNYTYENYYKAYRTNNEEYRLKQIQYATKCNKRRRLLKAEFLRLASILI